MVDQGQKFPSQKTMFSVAKMHIWGTTNIFIHDPHFDDQKLSFEQMETVVLGKWKQLICRMDESRSDSLIDFFCVKL